MRLIARTDKAFVAAINGPATGVGLAWALCCDILLAAEDATIVPAFGKLGLLPQVGTSWALTRCLGYQGAFAYNEGPGLFGGVAIDYVWEVGEDGYTIWGGFVGSPAHFKLPPRPTDSVAGGGGR